MLGIRKTQLFLSKIGKVQYYLVIPHWHLFSKWEFQKIKRIVFFNLAIHVISISFIISGGSGPEFLNVLLLLRVRELSLQPSSILPLWEAKFPLQKVVKNKFVSHFSLVYMLHELLKTDLLFFSCQEYVYREKGRIIFMCLLPPRAKIKSRYVAFTLNQKLFKSIVVFSLRQMRVFSQK